MTILENRHELFSDREVSWTTVIGHKNIIVYTERDKVSIIKY